MSAWILLGLLLGVTPQRASAIERVNHGVKAYRKGDIALAKEYLADAVATDPTCAEAHLARGQLLRKEGDLAGAEEAYEAGLKAPDPKPRVAAKLAYELGLVALRPSDRSPAELITLFDRAIEAEPRHYRAFYQRGLLQQRLDQPREADASFRRCIELSPEYAQCWVGLGGLYIDYGFADLGAAVLQAGLDRNPSSAEMWNGSARALHQRGRIREAIRAYERALRLEADNPVALFGLGMTHAEIRNAPAAKRFLEAFLKAADRTTPEHLKRAAMNALARMSDVI